MKEEIEMKDGKINERVNEGGEQDILATLLLVDVPWARAKQASKIYSKERMGFKTDASCKLYSI